MSFFSRWVSLSLVLLLVGLALAVNFYPLSIHPNDYLFSTEGDGLKNYYVPLYHIHHGDDLIFRGMFYPYGCHLLYGDSMPFLVYSIKFLSEFFPGILSYGVGIINGTLLASFLLASVFVFLIFEKFQFPGWANILVTVPVVLLSPQVYRLGGHYGLALPFIIPCWFYLMLRYYSKPHFLTLLFLFLSFLLAFSFHPYYGLIGLIFFASVAFASLWLERDRPFLLRIKKHLGLLSSIALAFAVFLIFMKVSDPDVDRVSNPYGMMEYRSKMEGLFVPLYGPVFEWINSIIPISIPGFEAYAYVGFPTSLFFVTLLLVYAIGVFKKDLFLKHYFNQYFFKNPVFKTLFWAAMLVYLLAMAYPMRLNMMFLLDVIPPLKQFRSLGRLAWVVHYILVFSALYFGWVIFKNEYLEKKNTRVLIASVLLLGLWYADVYIHFTGMQHRIQMGPNVFHSRFKSEYSPDSVPLDRYQAVCSVPLFQIGSEKMGSDYISPTAYTTMLVSFHSGMGSLDAMMTRLSIAKSQRVWSALEHPALLSGVWEDMPNTKPILLVYDKAHPCFSDSILKNLTCVFKKGTWEWYTLPVDYFSQKHQEYRRLIFQDSLKVNRVDDENVMHESFEQHPSPHAFAGNGAVYTSDERTILLNRKSVSDGPLEFSCWVYLNYGTIAMPSIKYYVYDAKGNEKFQSHVSSGSSYDLHKGWMRYRTVLENISKGDSVSFSVRYENTWIDELEIRPLRQSSFKEIGTLQLIDNYPVFPKP